jgi:predicted AAA+ superfamily ATPase
MFPLVPAELGDDFSLPTVLRYGSVPLVWQASDRRAVLESYVQLYLREEVKAEALVRNLPGFLRFLPIAAVFHGQVINVAGLARESGSARTTVDGYLGILEDTLLTFRLPAYEARLRVRERKHPKLFWVDPGIVRAVKKQLGPVGAEEKGALFEGWVLSVLRAHAGAQELFDEIAYWAPAQARQLEVDFLLRRGDEMLAIEVKAQRRIDASALRGLEAIAELGSVVRRVLVHQGERPSTTASGIELLPVETFLDELATGRLWP